MRSCYIIILQLVFKVKYNICKIASWDNYNSSSFIFTAPEDSTVWIHHNLFIHSAVDGKF